MYATKRVKRMLYKNVHPARLCSFILKVLDEEPPDSDLLEL